MQHNKIIKNSTFDEERALYNLRDACVEDCTFAGPADGESALKEAKNIEVKNCSFSLRYPLWHVEDFAVEGTKMDELTRAALWYCRNGRIENTVLGGIKALRECRNIGLENCTVVSPEFGWKSGDITLRNSTVKSEYLFLDCKGIKLYNVDFSGKYSFQYTENVVVEDSVLDTKDAFWHSKNVTVRNCTVKGEYLGWYSENLVFENCRITGTQPLCYCKGLKLYNCTMEGCDLAFEYSDAEADIKGNILSVKNPQSGTITADSVGEIIMEDQVYECSGKVVIR